MDTFRQDLRYACRQLMRRPGFAAVAILSLELLIVGEIALAVMLALGAGLLVRSFLNLQHVDTGVDSDGVVTMRLTLPLEKYRSGEATTAFFEELARRVETLTSVQRAGLVSQFPPQEFFRTRVLVDGSPTPNGATLPTANATIASRGWPAAVASRVDPVVALRYE